ncbi:histone acetyltransferase of the CBP family 12 [Striga asiatica]|uniref:Histone acetyltransferase of the CBP family 12 n=1 Tax=Striga asiatica TaxID=4170 RepID=A0A5A7Q1Z8_STRAF|nr:histone acetyltransferase of the CBP family 12 [Striga asiatica]
MSPSTLQALVSGVPPAIKASNGPQSKDSKFIMIKRQAPFLLQVKEKPLLAQTRSLTAKSRREMMQLTAASVSLLSLLLPPSAEARPRNATIKQKIMEKFEELRQKAGLSKLEAKKEENKANTTPENGDEEKKVPKAETFIPALPNIINGKTVESTLP